MSPVKYIVRIVKRERANLLVRQWAPLLWHCIFGMGRKLDDGAIGLGETLALDSSHDSSDRGDLRTVRDCRRWLGGVGGAVGDRFDVGGGRFLVRGVDLGRLGGRCDDFARGDWGKVRVRHTTS